MNPHAVAAALSATSVRYMFTASSAAQEAIPAGRIAITFDHLSAELLQRRQWNEIEQKVRAAQLANRGQKGDAAVKAQINSDLNWLRWFLDAQADTVVVTRVKGVLWWACFDGSDVADAGHYRYRQSRHGWQRIEFLDPKHLNGFDGWLTTMRPTAANRTIQEFVGLLDLQQAATTADRDARRLATARVLASRALQAEQQSGKEKGGTYKVKDVEFESEDALVAHILDMFEHQGGSCKLTALPMVLLGEGGSVVEQECEASLDRVSSNGHYVAMNLQLVCKFINRWKGTAENAHMEQLLHLVRYGEAGYTSQGQS